MQEAYPLPFTNWEARSWIRSKPSRGGSFDGQPFPLDFVPLAKHPRVAANPHWQEQILAYRLLAHLKFTTVLELEHVNPVCSELARAASPVPLSNVEQNDALKIYCDEGGHALFVELLAKSIEAHFEVQSERLGAPAFDLKLKRSLAHPNPSLSPKILRHLFVAVSETLVTRILRDIPHHPQVAPAVRAVIGDHANDEAYHSVYFRWYFAKLWQRLDERARHEAGRWLPELVWTFLEPDREVELNMLEAVGFSRRESEFIWEDTYTPTDIANSVRRAAGPTLEIFRRAGVFLDEETHAHFDRYHLIKH